MKYKDYVQTLNEFLEKNPETGNLDVITSGDDEGNSFNYVVYTPTIGYLDEDREFTPDGQELDLETLCLDCHPGPNAICVN